MLLYLANHFSLAWCSGYNGILKFNVALTGTYDGPSSASDSILCAYDSMLGVLGQHTCLFCSILCVHDSTLASMTPFFAPVTALSS